MKKSFSILIGVSVLLTFSLNTFSQSSEEELDQVELLKQLVGTWQADIAQDTVLIMKITHTGTGMYFIQEFQAKGKTYDTTSGIIGFSEDKQFVVGYSLWQNGNITHDLGHFVSPQKLISERFFNDQKLAIMMVEIEFQSPEQYIWRGKWRGVKMDWPEEWFIESTLKKVN